MSDRDFFDDMIKAQSATAAEVDVPKVEEDKSVGQAAADAPASAPPIDEKQGQLPHEARRALVYLLRQGSVLAQEKSDIFELICRYQDSLRNHLENMYLRLVIDERYGIAFIANAHNDEEEDGESVRLITRRTLTLYDTLLILVLRKYFQDRETQGEHKIVIDIETIEASLSPFLPLTNSARSDRKQLLTSLKRMIEKRILGVVRGSESRFEISPLIRYVVSAEFLQHMLNEYIRLAGEQTGAEPAQSDGTDDD
jgi:hypothetical protein